MGIENMILKIKWCKLVPIVVEILFLFPKKEKIEAKSGYNRVECSNVLLQKKILQMEDYFIKKGKRPTSHRSTTYPCYVPILGDFAGADRVGLAVANIQLICIFATENYKLLCCILQGI